MKPLFSLVLGFFLAAVLVPLQADDQGATVSVDGLFTYQAPPGWEIKEVGPSKLKVAVGPAKGGFGPNINVVNEDYDGALEKYVEASKAQLQKTDTFKNLTVVSETPFTAANGARGVRLLITDTVGSTDLQQIFYFFDATKGKLVVTATCLAATGESFTPLFDASMKTFSPR